MALIRPVPRTIPGTFGYVVEYKWSLTTADHTGAAIPPEEIAMFSDFTWHANGTNWGGATAAAEGSHTDTSAHFGALKNVDAGSAITFTADGGSPQTQTSRPQYTRARLSTTGTSAVVDVILTCSRNMKG